MCGRFTLRKDSDALAAHFEVEDAHPLPPRYNIAPSQHIPVVRAHPATGRRELVMQRWGLDPPWTRGHGGAKLLINARAETLASRPAFRDAFQRRRCLIPADGFYEWQQLEQTKQPWFIRFTDDRLFAFAGLWEPGPPSGDGTSAACTIITTSPIPELARIHDRMPAILPPAAYAAWLDPDRGDAATLTPFLMGSGVLEAAKDLASYRVRPTVNRADNDTAACLAAV